MSEFNNSLQSDPGKHALDHEMVKKRLFQVRVVAYCVSAYKTHSTTKFSTISDIGDANQCRCPKAIWIAMSSYFQISLYMLMWKDRRMQSSGELESEQGMSQLISTLYIWYISHWLRPCSAIGGGDQVHLYLKLKCSSDHRPHSRQVTGACCTEVAARQSWAEYSSRPTADSRHQAWAIKDFVVLSEMLTICEQPLYGIVLMILHTNKSCLLIRDQNSQIVFEVHLKHSQCFGTLAQPSHFLSNTPVMTQRIFTGPARVEWLWVNDFGPNEYLVWHGWPSTCWHMENKSPKYEVPIFTAQTCNHWRKSKGCASVPKNGLPNWCDWILCQCQ